MNMRLLFVLFFIVLPSQKDCFAVPADCILFSYNRPTQLHALLESMELYLKGLAEVVVIYRSDERFKNAYNTVAERFPVVVFVEQTNPPYDFKPLLMAAFNSGKSPYIVFGVDDIMVKNYADIELCTQLMESTSAYAFYLRLGLHINEIYPTRQKFTIPSLKTVAPSVFEWSIMDNSSVPYWGYPNTVDMTIYRKADIQQDLITMDYRNPNLLEGIWCGKTSKVRGKTGLCFARSIIVNIPVNQVQTEWQNPITPSWSPDDLLHIFEQRLKIDIKPFFAVDNPSCHQDYPLQFVSQ